MNIKLINVIVLGFGFMFVFTAFQTMGNIEKTLLTSISAEKPNFHGDAYTSLAIIYIVLAVFNWLAPSFLSVTGPRIAMVTGGATYTLFIVSFLFPETWFLYLTSVIVGIGASITWTGQGTYLTRCSNKSNIGRNSGIFWALLQCSMFIGNIIVYFEFQDKTEIDKKSRDTVVGVLVGVSIVGIIILSFLRRVDDETSLDDNVLPIKVESSLMGAWVAFKSAGKLFITRDMMLLSLTFFYTGIELSFFSGVYGSSVGFTLQISSSPKRIVGLAGICIGVGEVVGGSLFGLLGSKTTRYGRDPIVITGFIVHIIAFILTFLNLPDNAPFKDTNNISVFNPPQPWIALFCAFLLGFGDSCFNTQIYSLLGDVYAKVSISAFSVFKFTQSLAAAICFFYSTNVGLRAQLGILMGLSVLGTLSFCIVEIGNKKRNKLNSERLNTIELRVTDNEF